MKFGTGVLITPITVSGARVSPASVTKAKWLSAHARVK
jgi:hypothetical protein